jgi:hypothetical protein
MTLPNAPFWREFSFVHLEGEPFSRDADISSDWGISALQRLASADKRSYCALAALCMRELETVSRPDVGPERERLVIPVSRCPPDGMPISAVSNERAGAQASMLLRPRGKCCAVSRRTG